MKLDAATYRFFYTLTRAIAPFRSHHNMPDANVNGCLVAQGGGKNAGTFRFGFLAKGQKLVTIDIVSRDICDNPGEYIGNTLEALDAGMKQAQETRIILPKAPRIHYAH